MAKENYIKTVEAQEAKLQFPHFSKKDAWDLGNIIAQDIVNRKLPASVSIRLANGLIVYQYMAEGASLFNEYWMTRKFNTAMVLEESGLLTTLKGLEQGQTIEDRGLNMKDHCSCGGSFPIRIKGGGIVGIALISGLFHFIDHGLLVDGIAKYLKMDRDVPRLPPDAKDPPRKSK
jgi:uncharacterized protein (UPF0303 family)